MPHLGKCFIYVLSLYVLGMVIMRHCGQSSIVSLLSGMTGSSYNSLRQRLRELTYDAKHKRGRNRQEIEVSHCFAPLLGWILSQFRSGDNQVVLALDATYLKDRFIILAVSVVVARCAIPVAWHIRKSDTRGEWNPIWFRLLDDLRPAIPPNWQVFVLSDSGLYSKKLFQKLRGNIRWASFMRIGWSQGFFQAESTQSWTPIRSLVFKGMKPLSLKGRCFKGNPIACTLILQWDASYEQPCILVSNLEPDHIEHNIYAIRYWIECGFKDFKRGLFHWEQSKITCPRRAERLWLVMSIALLWLTSLGDAAADQPHWRSLRQARTHTSILSAPLLGWIDLILSLINHKPLSFGYLNPYPWIPLPEQ